MMKRAPSLVSIVTPTYNSSRYLDELLCSVESQEYPTIEHIVIDDGSADLGATRAVLSAHPNVRWWSRENRGQYATLNEGLRAAKGQYVTIISADDLYANTGAVGAMARFLDDHEEHDAVHGFTVHVDRFGATLKVQPFQIYPYWMLQYNLGFLSHCSLLVRRERLLLDGLLFDESLHYTGDGDWEARLYLAGLRFGRIDRPVGAYRHHEFQVTTMATGDAAARAARNAEHAAVRSRYAKSRLTSRLVDTYVTFQQRRTKASAAWRSGGPTELWENYRHWLGRKREGRTAHGG
jgi:glycosyltransferase involved in cell wall biosynthesis